MKALVVQPGEGPSRGLLRDCTSSPINRLQHYFCGRSPDGVLGLEAEEEGRGEVSHILHTLLVAGGSEGLQVAVEESHEVPAVQGH